MPVVNREYSILKNSISMYVQLLNQGILMKVADLTRARKSLEKLLAGASPERPALLIETGLELDRLAASLARLLTGKINQVLKEGLTVSSKSTLQEMEGWIQELSLLDSGAAAQLQQQVRKAQEEIDQVHAALEEAEARVQDYRGRLQLAVEDAAAHPREAFMALMEARARFPEYACCNDVGDPEWQSAWPPVLERYRVSLLDRLKEAGDRLRSGETAAAISLVSAVREDGLTVPELAGVGRVAGDLSDLITETCAMLEQCHQMLAVQQAKVLRFGQDILGWSPQDQVLIDGNLEAILSVMKV